MKSPDGQLFYLSLGGSPRGPYTGESLRRRLAGGELPPDCLASRQSENAEWIPLAKVLDAEPSLPVLPAAAPATVAPVAATPAAVFMGGPAALVPVEHRDAADRRYAEGYETARSVVATGKSFKNLAIFVVVIAALIGFSIMVAGPRQNTQQVVLGFGIIIGAMPIASGLWGLGTLVMAGGQMLLAQLDVAVHTSPFLNLREKAAVVFPNS